MEHKTKQCSGLIAHFVDENITCVRDIKTGKFVKRIVWKKATEKQALAKAYAIVALQPINKGCNSGYKCYNTVNRGNSVLSFAIIGVLLAVLTILLIPTIKERQAHYERVNSDATINSVACDKAVCNNFDYTKGVN